MAVEGLKDSLQSSPSRSQFGSACLADGSVFLWVRHAEALYGFPGLCSGGDAGRGDHVMDLVSTDSLGSLA